MLPLLGFAGKAAAPSPLSAMGRDLYTRTKRSLADGSYRAERLSGDGRVGRRSAQGSTEIALYRWLSEVARRANGARLTLPRDAPERRGTRRERDGREWYGERATRQRHRLPNAARNERAGARAAPTAPEPCLGLHTFRRRQGAVRHGVRNWAVGVLPRPAEGLCDAVPVRLVRPPVQLPRMRGDPSPAAALRPAGVRPFDPFPTPSAEALPGSLPEPLRRPAQVLVLEAFLPHNPALEQAEADKEAGDRARSLIQNVQ
eukprot:2689122-Pyramimonas_sp.AAC.2